jgi:phosphate transport system substrate-binding protein
VANRSYPLTRTVYFYINRTPGKPVSPLVREFLRYILSREGQADVARQEIYLPLTPAMLLKERAKLD